VLPAYLLLRLTLTDSETPFGAHFATLARNSFLLAGLTAVIAVALAVLLAYARACRRACWRRPSIAWWPRLRGARFGDRRRRADSGDPPRPLAGGQWQAWFGDNPGLLLTGGIAALVYAYLVRFLAVALQSVGTSLAKITPSMDDAARSLGLGAGGDPAPGAPADPARQPVHRRPAGVRRCHEGVAGDAGDAPFDFDTLATQAYTLASDERLAEAASVSLAIVAVGLLPLIVLSRQISRARSLTETSAAPRRVGGQR
jgi:iron(III) transport system permease protein